MFSKTTKIDEIFTVDLTLFSKCQIDGEDSSIFVAFLENMKFNALVPKEVYKPSTGPPERTGTPGLAQSPFGQVLFNRRKKSDSLNFL